jgi:hypothetical protein
MPVKFVRTPSGANQIISIDSHQERIVVDKGVAKVVDTYLSHFADCPQADAFR